MQETSGEISGADSYMHAKSNRHGDSLVCVQSCEDWPGCTTAAPRLFVPLKPLVQDEKQETASWLTRFIPPGRYSNISSQK